MEVKLEAIPLLAVLMLFVVTRNMGLGLSRLRTIAWVAERRLVAVLLIGIGLGGSAGCISIPVAPYPQEDCRRVAHPANEGLDPLDDGHWFSGGSLHCARSSLTIGLFPAVGESHQNGLATDGRRLTLGKRVADYTLYPAVISGLNFAMCWGPTLTALAREMFRDFDLRSQNCAIAVLGYCKGARLVPMPASSEPVVPNAQVRFPLRNPR